jgi:hypothetical protein
MFLPLKISKLIEVLLVVLGLASSAASVAADRELLDILLGNGVITQEQYDRLMKKPSLTSKDILGTSEGGNGAPQTAVNDTPVEPEKAAPTVPVVAASAPSTTKKRAWYDRMSMRGYTQLRYNEALGDGMKDYRHYADRSWRDNQSLLIRRARLIISGDITERLFLYLQPDFAVTPSGASQTHFVQLRDAYADIAFDSDKEFRIRVGQSKIPYGFENLQSSSNRLALDRNDAFNSCCRDERDLGAFFYWAPKHIRALFRDINKRGLKGSGDYGVLGFGIYNGQGANRFEANDQFHVVARASYPFQFDNGQILELGLQALSGRFMPPSVDSGIEIAGTGDGLQDARFGISAILYPQPFGLQAEWNWGRGPSLSRDGTRIDVEALNGGYVQTMYRWESPFGVVIPFLRWQYYDGAMKFERNAPRNAMTETDIGFEWQIRPEVELVTMYVLSDRTNMLVPPYDQVSGETLRFQLQWNY